MYKRWEGCYLLFVFFDTLGGLLADYLGYSSDIVSDFEIQHTSSFLTSY